MPVDIQIRTDLSLADLMAIHRAGGSVSKTPHVGNQRLDTMACMALGLRHKIVDANKGGLDRNFHPSTVICAGRRVHVGHPNKLMSHTTVEHQPDVFSDRFQVGARMSDVHMQALRDAVPQTNAVTWSHQLGEIAEYAVPLMEVVTDLDPRMWTRLVDEEGNTQTAEAHPRTWEHIAAHGVFGLHRQDAGWISPNIMNILIDMMVEARIYGVDCVYHLSGPDMFRYIKKLGADIDRYYDHARRVLGWNIPETLRFDIVPVSDMRFAVPASKRPELDHLIDVWVACASFESGVGARIRSAKDRKAEIARVQTERGPHHGELREAVHACPIPFFDMKDGSYTSQYDLLASGEALYVHPWGIETPIAQISAAFKTMAQHSPMYS